MSKPNLTEKQQLVYNFLFKSMADSIPPTVREICSATGIKSTSTVHAILTALEENGYISRDAKSSRAIRIEGTSGATQVPVLGKVTAGKPILAVEDIEDYIPYPMDYSSQFSDGLFGLRVSGLSMRDAGILDGDIIIADKNLSYRHGDIVVALIDDEATVKTFHNKAGEIILMPENPDYEPIIPQRENLQILGKVVGSFRKY